MAGFEPARACYGPTDFKSVASTIPPHRHTSKARLVQEFVQELKVGAFGRNGEIHGASHYRSKRAEYLIE